LSFPESKTVEIDDDLYAQFGLWMQRQQCQLVETDVCADWRHRQDQPLRLVAAIRKSVMSAPGQKMKSRRPHAMSALHLHADQFSEKADIID
jgi:hypothetical protein